MLEAWRSGAGDAVRRDGLAAASWRVATTAALLVIACATPVWLRGYLATEYMLPMLPVLGAASLVTFVVAAVGYPTAALLWVVGTRRPAQVIGGVAGAAWLLTAVVFQLWLGGSLDVGLGRAEVALLAWTFVAVVAVAGLWQPSPPARPAAAAVLVAAVAATLVVARGGVPVEDTGGYVVLGGRTGWLPAFLDRGPLDTLHTGALVAWVLLLVVGAVAWRIDRRLALAAVWLAPFVALSQLHAADAVTVGIALLVTAGVLASGLWVSAGRPST